MGKYYVTRKEVYLQGYEVEADSPEQAADIVESGGGEMLPEMLEYHDTPEISVHDVVQFAS